MLGPCSRRVSAKHVLGSSWARTFFRDARTRNQVPGTSSVASTDVPNGCRHQHLGRIRPCLFGYFLRSDPARKLWSNRPELLFSEISSSLLTRALLFISFSGQLLENISEALTARAKIRNGSSARSDIDSEVQGRLLTSVEVVLFERIHVDHSNSRGTER